MQNSAMRHAHTFVLPLAILRQTREPSAAEFSATAEPHGEFT
jgi:hypothetical protein